VTAFLEQYYTESDLQKFYKQYFPSLVGTPMSKVVGPNNAPPGIEASLDVEYMTTLGAGEYGDEHDDDYCDEYDDEVDGDVDVDDSKVRVILLALMLAVRIYEMMAR